MADLPSGTVTFLFTDIEGSTRLLQQLGAGYPAILAAHQQLLRSAFQATNGYEVDTQGDSFFVTFARAADAVAAAAAKSDWDALKADVPKLQSACSSCHNQYRERLDDGTYRFKPPAR